MLGEAQKMPAIPGALATIILGQVEEVVVVEGRHDLVVRYFNFILFFFNITCFTHAHTCLVILSCSVTKKDTRLIIAPLEEEVEAMAVQEARALVIK